MLSKAFMDDPFFMYLFPDCRERKSALPVIYCWVLSGMMTAGDVFATSEKMEGIFVIERPRQRHSLLTSVRTLVAFPLVVAKLACRISLPGLFRRSRAIRRATRTLFDAYDNYRPAIHLRMIAVDPRYRGQKLMTAMMREILADAGRLGAYCVLDTENEGNIPLYEHFGFQKAHEIVAIPGKMTYYLMVHEPGTPPA